VDPIDHITHHHHHVIMMQPASFMMIDHHHRIVIAFRSHRNATIDDRYRCPKIFPLSTVDDVIKDVGMHRSSSITINRPAI